jgi:LAO/AO transport system kinase
LASKPSALRVQPGVSTPASPDSAAVPKRQNRLSREQYVEGVLAGDRKMLARAITLIESSRAEDAELAQDILEACLPHTGNSIRLGITGVPGAGKSTLIDALGMHLIREHGQRVAVLAIDPSSELSGGSILGDKTRMNALSQSEEAFIRPSPSRGALGGVAQRTREAMLLCEAAGFHRIIVETVGTGQSEVAVHSMVDFFLLLMISGAGDELQGMKRGVMEMADAVVINKADGDNRAKAERTRVEFQSALHFFPPSPTGWTPRSLTCSALTGEGIPEIWNCVSEHTELLKSNDWFDRIRHNQLKKWMHEVIERGLIRSFRTHPQVKQKLAELEREVTEGRLTSFRAANRLLQLYKSKEEKSKEE